MRGEASLRVRATLAGAVNQGDSNRFSDRAVPPTTIEQITREPVYKARSAWRDAQSWIQRIYEAVCR